MKKFKMLALLLVLGYGMHTQAQESSSMQVPPRLSEENAPNHAQSSFAWATSYKEASEKASQENKNIILLFTGSDWCEWCKKMDKEIFQDPDFQRLAGSRFVFLELDFPMNKILPLDVAEQNAQLKYKYGITGYPTVVVLDSKGNFVAETGYRPGGGRAYAEYLLGLIQK